MSAIGPKPTSQVAPHMSAFGGKADIRIDALGGYRKTSTAVAAKMSDAIVTNATKADARPRTSQ
jgi:hypothetical protein